MRRIIMFNRVSADGFFADANGGLDWVLPEPALDKLAAERLRSADTILFGRRTYDMFESFWPHAMKDGASTAPDPHGPMHSPEMRTMALWLDSSAKIVFSRTRESVSWKNSRLLHELDPKAVVKMKRATGGHIMIFGSGSIVACLAQHGLIDEYQFAVTPIMLGAGRTLFGSAPTSAKLELLESRTFPSGNVLLRYAPADGRRRRSAPE